MEYDIKTIFEKIILTIQKDRNYPI
jgi:hypothetical protein